MYVLVNYKNDEGQMKMNALEWSRHYKTIF